MRRRPRKSVDAIKTAPPRATATLGPAPNPPVLAEELPVPVGGSDDSSGRVGTALALGDGAGSAVTPCDAEGAGVATARKNQ
jgi:hypothetical protein